MLTNVTFLLTNVKKKVENMCNSVLLNHYWYRSVTFSNLFLKLKLIIKRSWRYEKASSDLFFINQNYRMTNPILYLSMILGLGGVYVLIASFNDDDDDSDGDGEKYVFNLEYANAGR